MKILQKSLAPPSWILEMLNMYPLNNPRNGFPALRNHKKELLHDPVGHFNQKLEIDKIQDGGGRHLES